ncbi:putative DNA-invertase from lambdoid prophage Rac [Aliarcobacter thereius]|uniref:DNA-invertase from lambdoid prophage Rac n=2 Tax=Aliarcobacter thereius TaxID=544718 RepID=A0A1C7WU24_9BACT|nr:recombinase family protein [Aliarcobacter thereius]OCL86339.1 putative DNA-invertase from lambdoid prophage Rac [Aliarcobacter thereius]OCL90025.1 putative DNA-invertase from lambdoid prophage Rac [Aliarcobacter thereius]OCL96375.1 putative DNA-invertase from lambdoid prophage Rac [Aliarcobacter thereius LMG 24486]OCL98664.1 putative DNA-invertase from lambdoid prophage Rac [Aliarcobacter thereius]QBF15663.1 resolvase [Aliarcobacter thereius LMG 24486]
MSKVFTYIRASEAQQDYAQNQKKSIENYVSKKRIEVYKEIIIEINRPQEERNLLKLIENCEKNSTLIVANLNVFGRTINAILKIVKYLLSNNIRIVIVEQNLDLLDEKDPLAIMVLNIINVAVNLEKELQSLRTKEALNAKKLDGIALGKPVGTIQKSKFDEHRDKIEELLAMGMSVRKIAKLLGYNNHIGLNNYVKKRDIKEQVLKKQELI